MDEDIWIEISVKLSLYVTQYYDVLLFSASLVTLVGEKQCNYVINISRWLIYVRLYKNVQALVESKMYIKMSSNLFLMISCLTFPSLKMFEFYF